MTIPPEFLIVQATSSKCDPLLSEIITVKPFTRLGVATKEVLLPAQTIGLAALAVAMIAVGWVTV